MLACAQMCELQYDFMYREKTRLGDKFTDYESHTVQQSVRIQNEHCKFVLQFNYSTKVYCLFFMFDNNQERCVHYCEKDSITLFQLPAIISSKKLLEWRIYRRRDNKSRDTISGNKNPDFFINVGLICHDHLRVDMSSAYFEEPYYGYGYE